MADHLLANKFSNLSVGFFSSEWFRTLEIVNCFKNLVSTSFLKAQNIKELLELSVSLSWKKMYLHLRFALSFYHTPLTGHYGAIIAASQVSQASKDK